MATKDNTDENHVRAVPFPHEKKLHEDRLLNGIKESLIRTLFIGATAFRSLLNLKQALCRGIIPFVAAVYNEMMWNFLQNRKNTAG